MGATVAAIENRSPSVAVDFLERVRATPEREAYRYPVQDPGGGETWASMTWAEAGQRVRALAAGLVALGVTPEDRVAIICETRVEWILADFAILCAGAATTTVYPSTNAEETAYILGDSASRAAFAENAGQLAKLRAERDRLGGLRHVVLIDGDAAELADPGDPDGWLLDLDALAGRGRDLLAKDPELVDRIAGKIRADQLATLIYTSGTTGRPKGVRLLQDCWAYQAAAQQALEFNNEDDVQYLWLPLAHCFGKTLLAGQLRIGYVTAVDGRVTKLVENLPVVRPTFMAGAPRVYEKVVNAVTTRTEAEGGLKLKIFTWAVGVGRAHSRVLRAGGTPSPLLRVRYAIADRLVFTKLRALFGGRMRGCISGSAALPVDVAEFFDAIGVPIYEGYGLTESSAGSLVNRPGHNRLGTVGLPLAGTEVRIADDGEVLLRGPGVMTGYHNLPGATAEALEDGWLHTGDIGELDADGFLRITDRKKDLIKTSGGKYVAPSEIEGRFKGLCPYVSNIVVHGNNRNYCTALITLDESALATWAAGQEGDWAKLPHAELTATAQVRALVQGYIDTLNAGLQRWQTVKRFDILPRDLSVEDGELTPSLKVKRAVVERVYRDRLDALYEAAAVR